MEKGPVNELNWLCIPFPPLQDCLDVYPSGSDHIQAPTPTFLFTLSPLVPSCYHNLSEYEKYFPTGFICLVVWLTLAGSYQRTSCNFLVSFSLYNEIPQWPGFFSLAVSFEDQYVMAVESENHLLMILAVEVEGRVRNYQDWHKAFLWDLERVCLREWSSAGDRDVEKCIPSSHQLSALCRQGGKGKTIYFTGVAASLQDPWKRNGMFLPPWPLERGQGTAIDHAGPVLWKHHVHWQRHVPFPLSASFHAA